MALDLADYRFLRDELDGDTLSGSQRDSAEALVEQYEAENRSVTEHFETTAANLTASVLGLPGDIVSMVTGKENPFTSEALTSEFGGDVEHASFLPAQLIAPGPGELKVLGGALAGGAIGITKGMKATDVARLDDEIRAGYKEWRRAVGEDAGAPAPRRVHFGESKSAGRSWIDTHLSPEEKAEHIATRRASLEEAKDKAKQAYGDEARARIEELAFRDRDGSLYLDDADMDELVDNVIFESLVGRSVKNPDRFPLLDVIQRTTPSKLAARENDKLMKIEIPGLTDYYHVPRGDRVREAKKFLTDPENYSAKEANDAARERARSQGAKARKRVEAEKEETTRFVAEAERRNPLLAEARKTDEQLREEAMALAVRTMVPKASGKMQAALNEVFTKMYLRGEDVNITQVAKEFGVNRRSLNKHRRRIAENQGQFTTLVERYSAPDSPVADLRRKGIDPDAPSANRASQPRPGTVEDAPAKPAQRIDQLPTQPAPAAEAAKPGPAATYLDDASLQELADRYDVADFEYLRLSAKGTPTDADRALLEAAKRDRDRLRRQVGTQASRAGKTFDDLVTIPSGADTSKAAERLKVLPALSAERLEGYRGIVRGSLPKKAKPAPKKTPGGRGRPRVEVSSREAQRIRDDLKKVWPERDKLMTEDRAARKAWKKRYDEGYRGDPEPKPKWTDKRERVFQNKKRRLQRFVSDEGAQIDDLKSWVLSDLRGSKS